MNGDSDSGDHGGWLAHDVLIGSLAGAAVGLVAGLLVLSRLDSEIAFWLAVGISIVIGIAVLRWERNRRKGLMVGYGVILYGFSVYATDQAAGADFSTTTLSLGYGGSVFVGGLLAIPIGHLADKRGVRSSLGLGHYSGA